MSVIYSSSYAHFPVNLKVSLSFANVAHSLTLSFLLYICHLTVLAVTSASASIRVCTHSIWFLHAAQCNGVWNQEIIKMRNSYLISKLLQIIQAEKKKSMLTNISLLIQKISPKKFWVLVAIYPLKVIITFNWDTNIHDEQLIFSYTHVRHSPHSVERWHKISIGLTTPRRKIMN